MGRREGRPLGGGEDVCPRIRSGPGLICRRGIGSYRGFVRDHMRTGMSARKWSRRCPDNPATLGTPLGPDAHRRPTLATGRSAPARAADTDGRRTAVRSPSRAGWPSREYAFPEEAAGSQPTPDPDLGPRPSGRTGVRPIQPGSRQDAHWPAGNRMIERVLGLYMAFYFITLRVR